MNKENTKVKNYYNGTNNSLIENFFLANLGILPRQDVTLGSCPCCPALGVTVSQDSTK